MILIRSLVATLSIAMLYAPLVATASDREDTEFVAAAAVLRKCPITTSDDVKQDNASYTGESSIGQLGGTLVAGLAGDAFAAGLNVVAAALEEASKEKGFSAVGTASFNYYDVDLKKTASGSSATLTPSFPENGVLACIVLSYGIPHAKDDGDSAQGEVAKQIIDARKSWLSGGFPLNPLVYVEAVLESRSDGFIVRPTVFLYRKPLPGAPKRALPTEIQVQFSLPSSSTDGTSTVFGLARIRLPDIRPGTTLSASELLRYSSGVIPDRPTKGTPEAAQAAVQKVYDEAAASSRTLDTLRTKTPSLIARKKQGINSRSHALERPEIASAQADYTTKAANLEEVKAKIPRSLGSTNVAIRVTFIRNANQFGLAMAQSIQNRSKTAGDSLTEALKPVAPSEAWSPADTNYVTTMVAVDEAMRKVDEARTAGDADAVFARESDLKKAKANANQAAAASKRSIPFPGVI